MNKVKCGNCGKDHASSQEVRDCYNAAPLPKRSAPPEDATKGGLSPAQERFIRDLLGQLEMEESALDQPVRDYSKDGASRLIDSLLQQRSEQALEEKRQGVQHRHEAQERLSDGMYRLPDGTIYKVQKAVHGSGRLYAKRLVPPEEYGTKATFKYEASAINKLQPEHRMTLEQAQEFGALYGTCCVCGRTLTREESIEAGIGPVCSGKGGWGGG